MICDAPRDSDRMCLVIRGYFFFLFFPPPELFRRPREHDPSEMQMTRLRVDGNLRWDKHKSPGNILVSCLPSFRSNLVFFFSFSLSFPFLFASKNFFCAFPLTWGKFQGIFDTRRERDVLVCYFNISERERKEGGVHAGAALPGEVCYFNHSS